MTREELEVIVSKIQFRDWKFRIGDLGDGWFLQATFKDYDHDSHELALIKGRKWYISFFAIPDEVVKTAWIAVELALRHEAMEQFMYDGYAPFHPHHDVVGMNHLPMCHRTEIVPEKL